MSEVPLYMFSGVETLRPTSWKKSSRRDGVEMTAAERFTGEGYLAHKKPPTLGPYSRPMPRALWWSYGGGGFL